METKSGRMCMLLAKQRRPSYWEEKRLPDFGDDTAGNKAGKGQKLLGEEARSRGVVCSIVGRDCNFRFSPVSSSIRAKMTFGPGHFFGAFVWCVVWRLR